MRKIFLSLAVISFLLVSCVKLDEGPSWSIYSKKQRLAREWVVDSMYYPFTGYTSLNQELNDLRLIFEKKDNLTFFEKDSSGILIENSTSWNWLQPGYMIEIDFSDSQSSYLIGNRKYILKRLTRNELILEDHEAGNRWYFHAF